MLAINKDNNPVYALVIVYAGLAFSVIYCASSIIGMISSWSKGKFKIRYLNCWISRDVKIVAITEV